MILDNLVLAVFNDHHHHALSKKDELILKMIDFKPQDNTLYEKYMQVLDYVGGLTDNRAAKLAQELSGLGILT